MVSFSEKSMQVTQTAEKLSSTSDWFLLFLFFCKLERTLHITKSRWGNNSKMLPNPEETDVVLSQNSFFLFILADKVSTFYSFSLLVLHSQN